MRSRHVVATISLLCLGGIVLWHVPLRLQGHADVVLLFSCCAALAATHWTSRALGPWAGAIFAWFVGASVPIFVLGVGALAEYILVRDGRLLLEEWRGGGLLVAVTPLCLAFGAAFATLQLASTRTPLWQRLGTGGLAPVLLGLTWSPLAWVFEVRWFPVQGVVFEVIWFPVQAPFLLLAAVVTVVGCLRGVEYPADPSCPISNFAGFEPSEPVADPSLATGALLEARARARS